MTETADSNVRFGSASPSRELDLPETRQRSPTGQDRITPKDPLAHLGR